MTGPWTGYKYLPSTTILFITDDDIFGRDIARYTFSEWCEEVPELPLGDGTKKIFLNMTSKNGYSYSRVAKIADMRKEEIRQIEKEGERQRRSWKKEKETCRQKMN